MLHYTVKTGCYITRCIISTILLESTNFNNFNNSDYFYNL